KRILLLRDVAGFLEQRQVDVRFDIALRSGVAIPVPGAAEVAALLDDAKVLHARLAQTCAREQAAEAAADNQNLQRLMQGLGGEAGLDIRIVDIVTEVSPDLDVLFVTVGTDALVALLAVLGAESIGIETELFGTAGGG